MTTNELENRIGALERDVKHHTEALAHSAGTLQTLLARLEISEKAVALLIKTKQDKEGRPCS